MVPEQRKPTITVDLHKITVSVKTTPGRTRSSEGTVGCHKLSRRSASKVNRMLAWMDLEMTGLDPSRHLIVEVATIITDDNLEIIAEGPDLVVHRSESELESIDEFVRGMHTKSGLMQSIVDSTIS